MNQIISKLLLLSVQMLIFCLPSEPHWPPRLCILSLLPVNMSTTAAAEGQQIVKVLRLSGLVRMNTKGHLTQLDVVGDISNFQKPFRPCEKQNDKVSMKDWQTHLRCYKR